MVSCPDDDSLDITRDRVQQGTAGYSRVQQGTTGYSRVQQGTKGYNKVQQGTTGYSRVQAELRDTFNIWYWTILYFFLNSKSSGKLGFME